jgi:hypothetical protein
LNDNPTPEPFKPSTVAEEYQKELDTLKAENKALREQLSTALESLAVAELQIANRQQLQTDLNRTLAELAQLKENPSPVGEQNPPPATDLSDKAGKVASFFKTLLAKDTKLAKDIKHDKDVRLPKDTISKIEEILGGADR